MKPGGASISLPTSEALLFSSRVQVDGEGSEQLDGREGELCRELTTNNHDPASQTSWTDSALSRITADTPLRPAHGEDLRAVAAAVSALSSPAPPPGDGEHVRASTQNQALSALLFLYRDLLESQLELDGVVRARTPQVSECRAEWAWQWVFPQQKRWCDKESGVQGRHHIDPSVVQKAVKRALLEAGVTKAASCHTKTYERFRTCWATRTSVLP